MMEKKKGFDMKGLIVRDVLVVVTVAIIPGLTGCGTQMARVEESQLKLQTMVEANAQQIATIVDYTKQNQHQLQTAVAAIKDVQSGTKKVSADIITLKNEQITLQEMVQSNSRQLTDNVAAIEQNQQQLQARIEDVQNGTKKVDADIITLGNEQITLQEMVKSNSQQLTDNVAAIEQKQYEWQGRIEGVQKNIQKLANSINVLENNLLKLQEIFQSSTQDLFSIMDIAGQKQLKFEERIQKHLQALTDSMSAIEQTKAQLQKQIGDVQNSTGVTSKNVTAGPEQLEEAELFHPGPAQLSALAEPATPAEPTEIVKNESAGL